MSRLEKSIVVNAPVRAVYNQWTQFEDFPRFMKGIKEVRQLDDTHLHWCATVGGKDVEWDAEIVEQVPDQAIAWRSTRGKGNAGEIRFDKLDEERTRVHLAIDLEPKTLVEMLGTAIGVPSWRIDADLERFKSEIEARGQETGAWRGEAHDGRVTKQ
jgi:uncharacterized membrane protein